jgi:hypothetical protein
MLEARASSLEGRAAGQVACGLESVMRVSPLLFLLACASNPGGASRLDQVPHGDWGGEHVRLTVTDAGAQIEFDCAHGSLDEPLMLDASGRFDVKGTLVGEAGPIRKDDTEKAQPCRYRGETDGQHMSLEVTLEGGTSGGSFSLAKGGRARLVKCR